MNNNLRAATAALAFACASFAPCTGATDLTFAGYARDIKTQQLLYVEAHAVRNAGQADEQRVVQYRCPKGEAVFARKELRYGARREEPEFTLQDARSGFLEGLEQTARGYEVFERRGPQARIERRSVPANVAVVSDAGFDEFVRNHWVELEAGKAVRFSFLVPSRLDYMTFKVKKHHEATIEGQAASVIRLNLSGLLGWFLPYIEVSYRKSDRVLMRYKGLTNIRDTAGDNLTAQIDFPARERVVRPVDLAVAKSVPLVARCP
jgi:hypothetical protein